MVCQFSQSWTRPSEEEQSREIWHGPFGFRYEVRAVASLRSVLFEDFFPYHGGASEMFDSWPLHGLWTAEDVSPGDPQCERGGLRLSHGQVISVFLLLHQAKTVTLSGNTFYITVEKGPMGFQEIQFSNLLFPAQATATPNVEYTVMKEDVGKPYPVAKEGPPIDYNIAIVDTHGRELARSHGGRVFQVTSDKSRPLTTTSPVPLIVGSAAAK
jgi:hypothetical protein